MEKICSCNEVNDIKREYLKVADVLAKQRTVIDKVIREVNGIKIRKYNFFSYWIFVVFEIIVCTAAIISISRDGYPFWTCLSFLYLIAMTLHTAYKRARYGDEYLRKIGYDYDAYMCDEERRLRKNVRIKGIIKRVWCLSPVFIHIIFVIKYLNAKGEFVALGDHWWIVISVLLLASILSSVVLGVQYLKLLLSIYRRR